MKKLLLFFSAAAIGFAQTSNVQKSTGNNRLTAGFKVPTGVTLELESGSTFKIDVGAISSVMIDPMTTAGDMVYRNGLNQTDRLPVGGNGTILTVVSGLPVFATASFAPVGSGYITKTADSTLTGEFALGSLATGLLKNTTSTGVPTIGIPGTDYVAPGAVTTSGLTMATAKLLGRSTASTGAPEEITVGSGLTLSSGTLTASGGGGGISGPVSSTLTALARWDSTVGAAVKDSNVTLADSGTAFVFSGAGGITATSADVTLTPGPSNYIQLVGNVVAKRASGDTFFSIEGDTRSSQPAIGVYQNVSGSRTYGNYFYTEGTTSDFVIVSRASGVDNDAIRVKNADRNLVFKAYSAGTLTTDSSGNVTATSDERLKNIQGPFVRGLLAVLRLHPISYHWKESSGFDTKDSYSGFSAQNVESAIPEAVGRMPQTGYLTLQDRAVIATLANGERTLLYLVLLSLAANGLLFIAVLKQLRDSKRTAFAR